eukprot:6176340-Pleurochrysis_carterae.AAC.3
MRGTTGIYQTLELPAALAQHPRNPRLVWRCGVKGQQRDGAERCTLCMHASRLGRDYEAQACLLDCVAKVRRGE